MRNAHFQPAASAEAKMKQVDVPCGAEKVGAGALVRAVHWDHRPLGQSGRSHCS